MFIKIVDVSLQALWVNTDQIVAVIAPSPLSQDAQAKVVATFGLIIPVTDTEVQRVLRVLNTEMEPSCLLP